MKKILALLTVLALALVIFACTPKSDDPNTSGNESPPVTSGADSTPSEEPTPSEDIVSDDEPTDVSVMTHAEYIAAELETEVVVETYVQAKQSWWDNKVTVYSQDQDGAYFLYNMACSEEDFEKLLPGTKIRVTGYKAEWAGEIEIIDATFEFIDGSGFIAEARDVTNLLGTDELINHQNEFVSFRGLTVEPAGQNEDGEDLPFLYNWDGSGEDGSDLYFNVSVDGQTYTFTVESYLTDSSSEVYQAVKTLQIGDVIDAEGFLYWYEGVNPHITSVTPAQ